MVEASDTDVSRGTRRRHGGGDARAASRRRAAFSRRTGCPWRKRYADLLCTEGVLRGLIGPREAPRIWDRHLLNSVLMQPELAPGAEVADIGSGAGLPGVVLAIARPDVTMTLVEPLLRRTSFLEEVVAELGLDNVRVVRGRAEALHGVERFDVVTARAVSALDTLLQWCLPLVRPDGSLAVLKGRSATEEMVAAQATLRRWGCAEPTLTVYADEDDEVVPARVVRVRAADPTRVSWPPVGKRSTGRGERSRDGSRGRSRGGSASRSNGKSSGKSRRKS